MIKTKDNFVRYFNINNHMTKKKYKTIYLSTMQMGILNEISIDQ